MAKQKPGSIRLPKDIELPSREEMYRIREVQKKAEERRKRKEERERRKTFIESGVRAGFTVRQVLWLIKHFSSEHHEHWDGRVGGG